ncbi:MAG TPA: glycosyltransferase [Pyrinomonadaceae bacterium]|nr:glycosyltransferase [Pyrinomonadaceae bacterium]
MKPVAIVIPWFGADQLGGAEQQAFQIATRLAAHGHTVEVISTCNRSFHSDWSINHHPDGVKHEHGLKVRRFKVEPRDATAFDKVNAKLLALDASGFRPGVNPVNSQDADTFVNENIKCPALLDHIRTEQDQYHAFIFLPYMFAPAVSGVLLAADKAWLQPCLHDEAAAYLPQVAEMFRTARGLLFNSQSEFELAMRLYGPGIFTRSEVVGEGIEPLIQLKFETPLPAELQETPFVLYLGRRESTKNVDLLTRAFAAYNASHPTSKMKLALAGPGEGSYGSNDGIVDLGVVSEETKSLLLARCLMLAQPSRHESFSRVMMEAWSVGRPVAVHRDCAAIAAAVETSGGGWTAAGEEDWAQLFARLSQVTGKELSELGTKGKAYALEHANWDKVIEGYERVLGLVDRNVEQTAESAAANKNSTFKPRAIHQLLPDINYGDAISNQARAVRDHLRRHDYEAEIFVKRRDGRMAVEAKLFEESRPAPGDGLIYHHSIGSELTTFAVEHPGPKCLVYHNVTPPEFYEPYRPGFAWMLETGRATLNRHASHFPVSVGDSSFNAAELSENGFTAPDVLPIVVDPDRWNIRPDDDLMRRLQDGQTNVLYVGRIAPNKKQDRLVEAFARYHSLDPNSRLIIAGEGRASDPYYHHLLKTIERFSLESQVEVTGLIDDAALLAYYRTAHLFWSSSEHEGFGAPLVEAMWFEVPVLALTAASVPETLGDAGLLYTSDEDLTQVALYAFQLTHDQATRKQIIAAQRRRRLDFTPNAVWPTLERLIERLTQSQSKS